MGIRFFADQCVPNPVIEALRAAGHEVLRLREHIAPDSPDPVVISTAQELDAVLVSLNGDFADIVAYPPSGYKGIVAIQVRNHPEGFRSFCPDWTRICPSIPRWTTIVESCFW